MSWFAWALVIFLTALVTILGTAWLTGRGCVATEQPRERKRSGGNENADRWLPRAGRLELEGPFDLPDALTAVYGPFPVDTGPLLILSEQAAANVALEREIRQRCAEAEAKIPPRWRS